MFNTDFLYLGYKKYKDETLEVKNNYSLSFENLNDDELNIEKYINAKTVENKTIIPKNNFSKKMCNYLVLSSIISTLIFLILFIFIEYHSKN
jgi:hypothetical protein